MADLITPEDMENAKRDADDLAEVVNGAPDRNNPGNPPGTVTTRLGRLVKTMANMIAAIVVQEEKATNSAALASRYANNNDDAPISGAPDSTSRGAKFWANTALQRVMSLPNYYKGDPGGNIMSIPSFVAVRTSGAGANPQVIPSGTTMVMTAFHTTARYGRAFYERRNDIDDAYLAAYPRSSFKAKDEAGNVTRWALYADKEWAYEAFGSVPYTGTATAANDCSPAFDEMQALNNAYPAIGLILYGFSGRKVSVGPGRFYHTRPHNLHARWDFRGAGGGMAGAANTSLVFAQNIHGIVVNRNNTDMEQVVTRGTVRAADGSSYKDMLIESLGGTDRTKHGVWMRARATFEDVFINGFPGNNLNIVANSSTDGNLGTNLTAGNANDFQLTRVSIANSGLHAIYVAGIDANAGHCVGVEVLGSGCGGIMDVSFLGNCWTGCAVHGTNGRQLGRVVYNDRTYDLVSITDGIGTSTVPGTNENVWYDMGAYTYGYRDSFNGHTNTGNGVLSNLTRDATANVGATYIVTATSTTEFTVTIQNSGALVGTGTINQQFNGPGFSFTMTGTAFGVGDNYAFYWLTPLWSNTGTYIASNCVFSNNGNARSVFTDLYIEGGTCVGHVIAPSMIIGGQNDTGYTDRTPWMAVSAGTGGSFAANVGMGAFAYTKTAAAKVSFGDYVYSYNTADRANPGEIYRAGSQFNEDLRFVLKANNGGFTVTFANSVSPIGFAARGDTSRYGRSSPVVRNTAANNLNNVTTVFPNGFVLRNDGNGRKIHQYVNTPPTGQDYAIGEFAFTSNPAFYKCLGYSCAVATVMPSETSTTVTTEAVWYKSGALFIDAVTAAYDVPSLAPGAVDAEQTVTVTGAVVGDSVRMTYPGDSKGLTIHARVSAANTVKFFITNPTGNPNGTVDLASAAFKIRVEKM
jgi:hypothetical protein